MPFLMKEIVLSISMACLALGSGNAAFARPASHPVAVSKAKAKPAARRNDVKAKSAASPKRVPDKAAKASKGDSAKNKGRGKEAAKAPDRGEAKVRGKAARALPGKRVEPKVGPRHAALHLRAGIIRASHHEAAEIPEDQKIAQQLRIHPTASADLNLSAAGAFMFNQDTGRVLFEKNADAQLPVASLTKLMTALVIMRSGLPMDEELCVEEEDYRLRSSSFSRLRIGMTLSRAEFLHVALTGSDNRAAHVLARTYPGGLTAFVGKMNATARELGLKNTEFEEPTGLSPNNRSTAREITRIASEAYRYQTIRDFSTSERLDLPTHSGLVQVRSTNRLIHEGQWDIGLQKTGYTGAAGHCMVIQSEIGGNRVLMVVLNSEGKNRRVSDMRRMRNWYEQQLGVKDGAAELPYNLM